MGCYLFGNREIAGIVSQIRKSALQMQGYGVIGYGWDALGFQGIGYFVAVFRQDCILRIDGIVSLGDKRDLDPRDVGEKLVIPLPGLPAQPAFLGEDCQLFEEDSGLQGVQPPVDTHKGMLVFDLLAVNADLAHLFSKQMIIREHRTAIAATTERLGREEGGAADGG